MKRFVSLLLCVCLACGLCMTAFAVDIAEPDSGTSTTPVYPSGNYSYISNWKSLTTSSTNYFDAVMGSFRSAITALSNIYTAVDSVETYLNDIKGYTANLPTILTYVKTISTAVSGYGTQFTSMVNKLTSIDTNTTGQATKLTDIKSDVSVIKNTESNILSAILGLDTDGLATAANQVTLNNKVSTAENQVSMQGVLETIRDTVATQSTLKSISTAFNNFRTANWNKVMQQGYTVFTWNSTGSDWYIQATQKTTNTFNDSFNSAMLSLLNGMSSIANVVASPEDQLFSNDMNASDNKQNLSNWNQQYGQTGSSDALGVGSILTDNLSYMDANSANNEITNFLNGADDNAWKWFSQETYDDLEPSGTATLALDDDSIESVTPPPDDVVYFIDPDFTAADLLKQIKERNK